MKVRDAMTGDVLTMTPGRSLRDAAKFMADHNVGAVVIMDPEQPGPGIFTERDLVRSIGKGESPDDEHVVRAPDRPTPRSPTSSGTSRRPRTRWPRAASVTSSWSRHGELVRDHLDARHHAGVATERTSRSVYVTRGRTSPPPTPIIRPSWLAASAAAGSINLEPADGRRWSAIVAAVDGSLELRVARSRGGCAARWSKERWLADHGFARAVDCWALPLHASRRRRRGRFALERRARRARSASIRRGRRGPTWAPACLAGRAAGVGGARGARRGRHARRWSAASSTACTSSAGDPRGYGRSSATSSGEPRPADRAPAPRRPRQRDRPVARGAHAGRLSRGRRGAAAAGRGRLAGRALAPLFIHLLTPHG